MSLSLFSKNMRNALAGSVFLMTVLTSPAFTDDGVELPAFTDDGAQ